jgi:hypothetical protein
MTQNLPHGVVNVGGTELVSTPQGLIRLDDLLTWGGLPDALAQQPQFDLPVEHIFSGGVYIRQMFIPAGTIIVGKRHRHETCNMLLKGDLSVYTGSGKQVTRIQGPLIMTSEPMVRKIAYCHQDAVFVNIHPTEETDLEKIEQEFIITEPEYRATILEGSEEDILCLGAM